MTEPTHAQIAADVVRALPGAASAALDSFVEHSPAHAGSWETALTDLLDSGAHADEIKSYLGWHGDPTKSAACPREIPDAAAVWMTLFYADRTIPDVWTFADALAQLDQVRGIDHAIAFIGEMMGQPDEPEPASAEVPRLDLPGGDDDPVAVVFARFMDEAQAQESVEPPTLEEQAWIAVTLRWANDDIAANVAEPLCDVIAGGIIAIRATRDEVRNADPTIEVLPPLPGWSWYDWTNTANEMLAAAGRPQVAAMNLIFNPKGNCAKCGSYSYPRWEDLVCLTCRPAPESATTEGPTT